MTEMRGTWGSQRPNKQRSRWCIKSQVIAVAYSKTQANGLSDRLPGWLIAQKGTQVRMKACSDVGDRVGTARRLVMLRLARSDSGMTRRMNSQDNIAKSFEIEG